LKYLVTGAAGFIGSHLALELVSQGHQVIAVDALIDTTYPASVKKERWNLLKNVQGIELIEKDLTNGLYDQILEPVDIVINEAAMPGLTKSWTDIKMYSDSNLVVVGEILKSMRKFPEKRLVQISTSSVYGKNAIGDEKEKTEPYSPYGVTKLAAENLIKAHAANFGLNYTILRYFSVYGPGQRPDMAYSIFIDKISRNLEFEIYGDGTHTRTNTYIDDCVRGTIEASQKAKNGEIYNISGKQEISVMKILELLEQEIGNQPRIKHLATRPGDQTSTKGNTIKAFKDFGYEPRIDVLQGLKNQVVAYKNKTLFDNARMRNFLPGGVAIE
jgi:nucleoside-diphosphate-sugar epimerase